jgi:prepilin-type N-terminal cleavage/methylation domain-containing protein
MLQRLRSSHRVDSGFTLIELLITVTILGVLAGIVVFSIQNFTNDGVTAACKTDKKNVEIASEAYRAKNTGYAADIATLVSANYLREAPSSTKYSISYDAATGAASSTAC